jgi:hypothetical protein
MVLPGSFNGKRSQALAFFRVQLVLDYAIDAAAARTAAERLAKLVDHGGFTFGHDFDVAILSVAHPAAELEGGGFALDEPAKTHALHASTDEEVANHGRPSVSNRRRARKAQAEGKNDAQPDVTIRVRPEKRVIRAGWVKPIIRDVFRR